MTTLGPILFLHWGPGSNSAAERAWYGEQLPIHWWDQPSQFSSDATAFSELVDAAEAELKRVSDEASGSVSLVAHSFGGQIATELARRSPDRIASISMVCCATHPPAGFIGFARALANELGSGEQAELLRSSADAAAQELKPETFWPLMNAVTTTPGFFPKYWGSTEKMQKYLELTGGPAIEPAAFMALMNAVLMRGPIQQMKGAGEKIPVRCFFGRQDPLINSENETKAWKEIFPTATSTILEGGHFVHLENEPSLWMPA